VNEAAVIPDPARSPTGEGEGEGAVEGEGAGAGAQPAGRARRALAFDVALAALATAVEVTLLVDDGSASAAALVLTVVAGIALGVRRRAPLTTLAATLGAAAAVMALGEVPSGLTVLIALYTVAVTRERRASLQALLPAVTIIAGLSVVAADDGSGSDPPALVGAASAAALAVGIWGLGAYAQTRRRYERGLEQRAAQLEREREQGARIAVHEERAAIARELHDIVAHSVGVMLVGVRGARDVLRSSPELADDTLARVETSGEQSLAELRRMLVVLRERERSAEARPQPSLAELGELVADYRDAGLPVVLEVTGARRTLPGGVELSVYRIAQEALTNALKHAQPTRVTVRLSFAAAELGLEVLNDGARVEQGAARPGHGLVGMRERVALLGGRLEAGPSGGGRFRVVARLPVGGAS
jgi:signal transduction histidine kinase